MLKSSSETTDVGQITVAISYLCVSIFCLSFGVWCYDAFVQCDYVQYGSSNKTEWTVSAGYTLTQWWAIAIGTFLLPMGVLTLLICAFLIAKAKWGLAAVGKLFLFASLFVASLISVIYSYRMAADVLGCGVFCHGESDDDGGSYDSAHGAIYSIGMVYFFVCLIGTVLFGLLTLSAFYQIVTTYDDVIQADETDRLVGESTPPKPPTATAAAAKTRVQRSQYETNVNWTLLTIVFVLFYPFLLFATMSLPTWWATFSKTDLSAYLADIPDSGTGSYYSIKINSNWYLKLFPDILMYYLAIYLVVLTALAAKALPWLHKLLHFRPNFSLLSFGLSVGEMLLLVVFIAMVVAQFLYFMYDHGWEGENLYESGATERAARSMGQVANLLVGLMILPIARNSIWTIVFGVSHEGLIIYHAWIGSLLFFVILIHMCLWWKVYDINGTFQHDVWHIPTDYHSDNFTIPMGWMTFIFMIVFMWLPAINWVRRAHYEVFYYLHHFSMVVFAFMLWHATMSWYYILGGLVLWTVDHMIRLSRSVGYTVHVDGFEAVAEGTVTQLSYTVSTNTTGLTGNWLQMFQDSTDHAKPNKAPLQHKAGQYCFVNIPAVSTLEWHPFTISSIPGDSSTTHSIKSMGAEEWTGQLSKLSGSDLLVNIDGPYGTSVDCSRYAHVVLVAGGIGITPLQAVFRDTLQDLSASPNLKSLRLIWSTKTYTEAALFLVQLNDAMASIKGGPDDFECSCEVFITKSTGMGASVLNALDGRGDRESQLEAVSSSYDQQESADETVEIAGSVSDSDGNSTLRHRNVLSSSNSKGSSSFLDNNRSGGADGAAVVVTTGCRADLEVEVARVAVFGADCLVFACGPAGLVQSCADVTLRNGVQFSHETFEF